MDRTVQAEAPPTLQGLSCSLGPIIELFPQGMRVRCDEPRDIRPNRSVQVTVEVPHPLEIQCRIRWARITEGGACEVGLQFLDLSPQDSAAVKRWISTVRGSNTYHGPERRRHGRLHTELLTCEHGDIVDLSATGMKLRRRDEPPVRDGEEIDMTLESLSGDLTIRARVIWHRHVGDGHYEIGMVFVTPEPKTVSSLQQMARVSLRSRLA